MVEMYRNLFFTLLFMPIILTDEIPAAMLSYLMGKNIFQMLYSHYNYQFNQGIRLDRLTIKEHLDLVK